MLVETVVAHNNLPPDSPLQRRLLQQLAAVLDEMQQGVENLWFECDGLAAGIEELAIDRIQPEVAELEASPVVVFSLWTIHGIPSEKSGKISSAEV